VLINVGHKRPSPNYYTTYELHYVVTNTFSFYLIIHHIENVSNNSCSSSVFMHHL